MGLPCGEGLSCPEGQTCDIISNECGPASEALVLRDDTAADFAMPGADTAEVAIELQGFVGPIAYVTGGIRITGYDGLLVPDVATASFDDIVANNQPTGTGIERSSKILFGATNPPGLGLASPDSATILVEGEINFDALGNWRFRLEANDRGFFEIARPGSATFERVVADVNVGTIRTFTPTETGWHRFRGAFQDAAELLDFDLQADPPNVSGLGFKEIPVDLLRARASDVSGLLLDGFENANMLHLRGSLVTGDSLVDVTLGMDAFGLPIGIAGFSLRWSGQFLIDEQDDYTFALDTLGGHRLWIDGVRVADNYSFAAETSTSPVSLAPGWHDIVLDLNKSGGTGGGRLSLVVTGGGFADGVIPADHLRPIPGRVSRFVADHNTAPLPIPDGGSATRSLTLDLPPSMTRATDLTAAVELTAAQLSSISLVLDPATGANINVVAPGDFTGMGTKFLFIPLTTANAGSFWQFIGTDNLVDMLVGEITSVYVTTVYDGGIAPFATSSRYESAVRDLGDVVAYERIAWTTRQAPESSAVIVKLRTCETAEACAAEPYVEVSNASVPGVTARRFFQYAVEITSNGDVPTALDAIELRYFVRGNE